jgi:5-methylthioadenosine/S-adenosylhomocysteine deaminase
MSQLLLADADFVVCGATAVRRRASVAIVGSRIEAVGGASELDRRYPAAERLDCRGLILLPGLVNAHNHLFQVLMRGLGKRYAVFDWVKRLTYPVTRRLEAPDHYHSVLLACLDALRNGTTAIIDMPTHYARFHADEAMRAMQESGIRGAVVRTAADVSKVDPEENRPAADDEAAATAFLDRWQGKGIVQAWLGPSGFHSASPELFQRMKALASRRGVRFHIHLGESDVGRGRARERGHVGEVEWADSLGLLDGRTSVAHGVWVNDTEIALLRRSGAQVVYNASSNQVLASGVANIVGMRAAGIPIALGSDGPASNDSLDMVAEMKAAVLLQRVHRLDALALSAADVFTMATEGGARVLGLDDLGRLAPGYLGDVVGVRCVGNPSLTPVYDPVESLVYHGSGRDVTLTVVDGRVVYRDGAFPSVDAGRVLAEVAAIQARIGTAHPDILAECAAVSGNTAEPVGR